MPLNAAAQMPLNAAAQMPLNAAAEYIPAIRRSVRTNRTTDQRRTDI